MTSPVQLSDLDPASVADDADLALIRKDNTTDYRVTVALLRSINIPGMPNPATTPGATDYMMLSQASVNCKVYFGSVGFTVGTQMWFYMNAEPVSPTFWQIMPNTGDTLLGVKKAGSRYPTGGVSNAGSWTQEGVGGGSGALTIDQIPAHSHQARSSSDTQSHAGSVWYRSGDPFHDKGLFNLTTSTGGGQTHNHGSAWRPLASVGIICQKIL
jgi:hypothetical protein